MVAESPIRCICRFADSPIRSLADSPIRTMCSSRSRLSARCTPRLLPHRVWISSTMTVRTVRNISRARGLVSSR